MAATARRGAVDRGRSSIQTTAIAPSVANPPIEKSQARSSAAWPDAVIAGRSSWLARRLARPCAAAVGRLPPLLEACARVCVFAARPPLACAMLAGRTRTSLRIACFLGAVPQAFAREPLEHDVRVRPLQLMERRQELLFFAGAKRGRLVVDQNRPVGVARRHRVIVFPAASTSRPASSA